MQRVTLGNQLGEGLFGEIYEFPLKDKGETYAIKISKEKTFNSYIQKENSILRYLHRGPNAAEQNIIKNYAIFKVEEGRLAIALELLGTNLSDLLQRERTQGQVFLLKGIQELIRQLGEAIAFIHEAGIIHTNIKPSNIIFSRDDMVVKLADFSMACYEEPVHHAKGRIQSLFYRAPEVVLECEYGTAVDVWGFASVIAEVYISKMIFPVQANTDREIHLMAYHRKRFTKPYPSSLLERASNLGRGNFEQSSTLTIPIEETLSDLLNKSALSRQYVEKRSDLFCDLLDKMFVYDPKNRIKAAEILAHPFLKEPMTKLVRTTSVTEQASIPAPGEYIETSSGKRKKTENRSHAQC